MNVDEKTYHIINAYLSGTLQGRGLDKFKADLKNNTEIREAVAAQQSIIQAIETARDKELKDFISKSTSNKGVITISPKWRVAMASAAAIVLLAVVFLKLNPLGTNDSSTPTEIASINQLENAEDLLLPIDSVMQKDDSLADTQTLAIVTPQVPKLIEEPALEVTEDAFVEQDEEIEEVDNDGIEDDLNAEIASDTVTTANELISSTSKETKTDIVVLGDKLLTTKSYPVFAVALDLNPSRAESLIEVQPEATRLSRKERKVPEQAEDEAAAKAKPQLSRAIKVQYWNSVVNYIGYQYNGALLKLYGIDQNQVLEFKELDNRLYVRIGGTHFYLERNQNHKRLAEVSNPTLLKVLNE